MRVGSKLHSTTIGPWNLTFPKLLEQIINFVHQCQLSLPARKLKRDLNDIFSFHMPGTCCISVAIESCRKWNGRTSSDICLKGALWQPSWSLKCHGYFILWIAESCVNSKCCGSKIFIVKALFIWGQFKWPIWPSSFVLIWILMITLPGFFSSKCYEIINSSQTNTWFMSDHLLAIQSHGLTTILTLTEPRSQGCQCFSLSSPIWCIWYLLGAN